jgi:hypothetical protein
MITPYLQGPMAVSGFLWSQGECNADSNEQQYYACAFPLFLDNWRAAFGVPDLFFGFEVLPAYIRDATFDPASLPFLRDAQLRGLTLAKGRNVVAANALDLGDPTAPHGSVHPRDKLTVGKRFAAAALALIYGLPSPYRNPAYASAAATTAGAEASVEVFFAPGSLSGGAISVVPGACPTEKGVPQAECMWTEIQTSDGVWRNATTIVATPPTARSQSVVFRAAVPVQKPPLRVLATRSCFSPYPVVHLYSSAGLPALPWPATNVTSSVAL